MNWNKDINGNFACVEYGMQAYVYQGTYYWRAIIWLEKLGYYYRHDLQLQWDDPESAMRDIDAAFD